MPVQEEIRYYNFIILSFLFVFHECTGTELELEMVNKFSLTLLAHQSKFPNQFAVCGVLIERLPGQHSLLTERNRPLLSD